MLLVVIAIRANDSDNLNALNSDVHFWQIECSCHKIAV